MPLKAVQQMAAASTVAYSSGDTGCRATMSRTLAMPWPAFSSRPAVRPFTLLQPPPAAWAADLPASSAFLRRPSQAALASALLSGRTGPAWGWGSSCLACSWGGMA